MKWITVATPPFRSIEQFDAVLAKLGGNPDGLEQRYVGTAEDGTIRVVSLWESREHAERFRSEQLGPALAAALGPEPVGVAEFLGIEVQRSYAREPVG